MNNDYDNELERKRMGKGRRRPGDGTEEGGRYGTGSWSGAYSGEVAYAGGSYGGTGREGFGQGGGQGLAGSRSARYLASMEGKDGAPFGKNGSFADGQGSRPPARPAGEPGGGRPPGLRKAGGDRPISRPAGQAEGDRLIGGRPGEGEASRPPGGSLGNGTSGRGVSDHGRARGASRRTGGAAPTLSSGGRIPPPPGEGGGDGRRGGSSSGGSKPPTSSRSAAKVAKHKKRKRIIITAVAECIVLAMIFAYAYVAQLWGSIQRPQDWNPVNVQNKEISTEKAAHMKGFWNIAIFGVDSRGKNVGKGTNADVNMICNINMDTGEIKLVSVFRDTYLNINDRNEYNKLNAAYAEGGPTQAVKALNKNLDLNITDYVTFNWKAVADAINILGGVDVDISKPEFYYINSFITETVKATGVPSRQLKKAGPNHLDGVQAVAYGRLRLMDTDFARTERQRLIISKAFEKAKKAGYPVLNNILVDVLPQVSTSLSFEDLTKLALTVGKYHLGDTQGFPAARGDLRMGKRGDCVIPLTLESNVVQLHKFLFNKDGYDPTDTVKKISAQVASDSGMYNEGKFIGHVSINGGSVPKATRPKETSQAKEEESSASASSSSSAEGGTKAEGQTGENQPGGAVGPPGGNSSGWETWPTDENGVPYDPALPSQSYPAGSRPSGPGQFQGGRPWESSQARPDESSPARPGDYGPARPEESSPARPGDGIPASPGESSQARPGDYGPARPGETSQARPGETNPSQTNPSGSFGPGGGAPGVPSRPTHAAPAPSSDEGRAPTVAPPPVSQEGGSGQTGPGGQQPLQPGN